MSDVQGRFFDIISRVLVIDKSEITLDSSFAEDFFVNALNAADLELEVQEEFDIDVIEEELGDLDSLTVGEALQYIKKKIDEKVLK